MMKNSKTHSKARRHLGEVFKNKDFVLFVGIIVLITIFTSGFVAYYTSILTSKQKNNSATVLGNPAKILKSQEIAKTSAYTINILSVTENSKKDPAFTFADSDTMLIADVSITNNSSVTQDLIPSVQLYVRTSDGLYYQMHPSMYVTEPLQTTKLESGKTAKGQISFVIPKMLTHPYVYFDLGWENYTPAVYDILH